MQFSLMTYGRASADYPVLARAAEALGYEALWFSDHLVTPLRYDPKGHPFTTVTPWVDVWVEIGHLSALTTTLRFGSGVFVLPLRDPFSVAKAVMTAQNVSGGRVLFGFGLGWMEEEFAAVGIPFKERGARTDEMLEVIAGLWSNRPFAYRGRWHRFDEVVLGPGPCAPIPIVAGGESEASMRRAARVADAWYAANRGVTHGIAQRARLRELLRENGRDDSRFPFYACLGGPDRVVSAERHAEAGFEHGYISVPWQTELPAFLELLQDFAERTRPFRS